MTAETQPPAAPDHPAPLTFDQRVKLFGAVTFTRDPQPGNPEAVHINGPWSANLVVVEVPQLQKLGLGQHMRFHKAVAAQFVGMWSDWEAAGLIDRVKSFDGSFAPRFKRFNGSLQERLAAASVATARNLSNHAFGTAMDINASTNPLGREPAALGTVVCVTFGSGVNTAVARNNLAVGSGGATITAVVDNGATGLTNDHNLASTSATVFITPTPAVAADFALHAGSPAIGVGTNTATFCPKDYRGNTRNTPDDIGAYTYP
jgi:hypothetical protein